MPPEKTSEVTVSDTPTPLGQLAANVTNKLVAGVVQKAKENGITISGNEQATLKEKLAPDIKRAMGKIFQENHKFATMPEGDERNKAIAQALTKELFPGDQVNAKEYPGAEAAMKIVAGKSFFPGVVRSEIAKAAPDVLTKSLQGESGLLAKVLEPQPIQQATPKTQNQSNTRAANSDQPSIEDISQTAFAGINLARELFYNAVASATQMIMGQQGLNVATNEPANLPNAGSSRAKA